MPKPKAPKKQKPIEAYRLRLPSASSLSRAVRCPASQSLQRVAEPTSDAAQRGTNLHLFISLAVPKLVTLPIEEARAEALAVVKGDVTSDFTPEQLALCEVMDLRIFAPGVDTELALGYDETKHRAVDYQLTSHRDYPKDGLWHSTSDIVGMLDDDTVYVADVKTGDHEPASESWQLKLCAISACALTGAKRARVEMLKLWPSGKWSRDPHDLTEEDLGVVRATLLTVAAHVETGTPEKPGAFEVGPHCKFCPALRLCPAQTSMVRSMEPTLEVYIGDGGISTFGPDDLVGVFLRLQRYESALKLVREQLETIIDAAGGQVFTSDGKALTLASSPRREIRDGAVPLLLQTFGDACHGALSASVSKLSAPMLAALNDAGLVGFSQPKPGLKLIKAK